MQQIKAYGVSSATQPLGALQIFRRETGAEDVALTSLIAVFVTLISIRHAMNGAIQFIPWSLDMKL